ncbi:serine/threonine-protein kinase Nek8 isoform X2 [Hyalella azteca]|uniref:non-specific serine/threonine protein kinase n=1 Tax=Hyalella azteca TaxID=294128 RepID=A0A8B7NA59_HYAAZ|nr:serine/threonine-protein kinase Nek8 isoform X2 [Hyalella azteca]
MENYECIKSIGRGTFGAVHLFKRRKDGLPVVIKQISLESLSHHDADSSLIEVRVLSILRHPFIIHYHNSFNHDSSLMIVMEYAAGGNLQSFLQSRLPSNFLQEQHAVDLFTQMTLGLQHIHRQNILHRDLKPQNIFMDITHKYLKIGDFGISKILSSKSKAFTVVGTPCYLSPELCQNKPYNKKSDVWALGCILYELLTLKMAFQAETIMALFTKITNGDFAAVSSERCGENLWSLLESLLQQDAACRPTTDQVLASPAVMKTYIRLHMDMGRVPGATVAPVR